jgi:hypothetical protein
MMRLQMKILVFAAAMCFPAFGAIATPVYIATPAEGVASVTPAVSLIEAPANVRLDQWESNTEIFAFWESTTTLAKSVHVNITTPGLYDGTALHPLTPGDIAVGTTVSSYMLHSDPVSGAWTYTGGITFQGDILGVILLTNTLGASDDALGHPGTLYWQGSGYRGLELDPSGTDQETFMLQVDDVTGTVRFRTSSDIDEVRILTSVVPEPASIILFGTVLVGVMSLLRRRKLSS